MNLLSSSFIVIALLIISPLLVPADSYAQSYTLEKIVDRNTQIPDGSENFSEIGFPITLGDGNIAFVGRDSQQTEMGIYLYSEGTFSVIADHNTPVPMGIGNFSAFSSPWSLGQGNIAARSGNPLGIYSFIEDIILKVADSNTEIPMGTGNFTGFSDIITSLGGENLAFIGLGSSGQRGIYRYVDDKLSVVADTNTPVPMGSGNFFSFGNAVALSDGNLAFEGLSLSGERGIYALIDDELIKVVGPDDTIPMGIGSFFDFHDIVSLGGDDLAFIGFDQGQNQLGIYSYINGELGFIADLNSAIPMGNGNFEMFSNLVLVESGDFVFTGSGSSQTGVYEYSFLDETISVVIDKNTELPTEGSINGIATITSFGNDDLVFFTFLSPSNVRSVFAYIDRSFLLVVDSNTPIPMGDGNFIETFDFATPLENGNLAFFGRGLGGQQGIYKATPTPNGSLTIVKETIPDGGTGFEFVGTGFPESCGLNGSFTLDDNGFIDCNLPARPYTVEEIIDGPFTLTDIDCEGDSPFTETVTSVTIDLQPDDTIVCTFTNSDQLELILNKTGNGDGRVVSNPGDIDCDLGCDSDSANYDLNTMVTLTATPDPDSDFGGWDGDCSDAGTNLMATVTMSEAMTCEASFTLKQFDVLVMIDPSGTGDGTVTFTPNGAICPGDCTETYDIHTMVTLTPNPDMDSLFTGWSGPLDCLDGIIQDLTSDITCTATFFLLNGPPVEADISVTKIANVDSVEVGQQITYTFNIQNNGSNTAEDVMLTDVLPSSLSFVSSTAICANNSGTITCDLGDLANNASTNFSIVVTATQAGSVTNTAIVNSAASDPDFDNNVSSVTTQIVEQPGEEPGEEEPGEEDPGEGNEEMLMVNVEIPDITIDPGDDLSIPVEISNPNTNGTSVFNNTRQTVTGVVFTVEIPQGFSLEQLLSSKGVCDINLGQCNIGDIAPGETVTVVVDAIAPQGDGIFNITFNVSTASGQMFSGNATVRLEGSSTGSEGSDDGSGGCALAGPNTTKDDLLDLLVFALIPSLILIRRKVRAKIKEY